jgi:hypothetical protein
MCASSSWAKTEAKSFPNANSTAVSRELPSKKRQRWTRDDWLYWWPVLARVTGILGAFGQAIATTVFHTQTDPGFIAFCGTLIIAPAVFEGQDSRNRRRQRHDRDDK